MKSHRQLVVRSRRADAAGHSQTATLVALLRIEAAGERPTVRAIAAATGLSPSQVHKALVWLRAQGLVHWSDGQAVTLRSNVAVVVLTRVGTVPA